MAGIDLLVKLRGYETQRQVHGETRWQVHITMYEMEGAVCIRQDGSACNKMAEYVTA